VDEQTITARDGVGLHVGFCGAGRDVVMLSGGPGCVQYLERDDLVPPGIRAWFPEPRGVGRSGGGAHTMAQAVEDLEDIRAALGLERWVVLGHSWGSDLAVRYALDRPAAVTRVVGIAGHGLHKDRTWSEIYEQGKSSAPAVDIAWVPAVWQSLSDSFVEWIHEPALFRRLADSPVEMFFLAAGEDIRPPWPLQQLAALVPSGSFAAVPDVPHDFWSTHPQTWRRVIAQACLDA